MYFKVIIELDGKGVYINPLNPIHIDGLLVWALAAKQGKTEALSKNDIPDFIKIPLMMETINNSKVWKSSALFPENEGIESIQYYRKKFDTSRMEVTKGTANLIMGKYKEYNMPIPLLLINKLIGYCDGNRYEVGRILKKNIRYIGKYRSQGYGKIINIITEKTDNDYSLVKEGKAMRNYPHPKGVKICRSLPPYWNMHEAVKCLEVGDKIKE